VLKVGSRRPWVEEAYGIEAGIAAEHVYRRPLKPIGPHCEALTFNHGAMALPYHAFFELSVMYL